MQDGEHDALHIPGFGDASNNVTVGNNGNKLLIAATLTAIFLAGSAMVYRSRSMYSSSTMPPLFSTTSQKADEQATSSKDAQKGKREVRHADGEGEEPSDGAESNNGPSASVLPAKSNNEGESSGQSKSARRKERRKRGKDPLKEMQKGGKKLKALVPNTSGSATKDPAAVPLTSVKSKATVSESGNAEDGEEHADDASQASSSTSHLPDSQQTLFRSKGKRALREGSIDITGKGAATGAGILSHGDTSVSRHARVASTSEVSQKQYPQQSSDGPSSSKNPNLSRSAIHNSSQSHSDADTHSSNPRNQRPINTPSSSSTVHDDHPHRRPRSLSPAATTSSRRVTGHDEIDNPDVSNIRAADLERPDRLTGKSQVHQTGLADADTHSEADSTAGGVKQSHHRRTRARADEDADNAYGHSSINVDIPFDASTVETSSTATTTATGPASLASSLVLSSPATSPALSSSPYSVEQSQAGMKKVDNDDVEMITALSNTGKDKASSSSALPSSMSSSFTSTSTNTGNSTTRKAQKAQASGNASKGKSALPTPVPDPWDWDGVGSSSTVEASKEKGNDKSLKKKSSRSEAPLSSVAGSPMSSSVSHPSSLYSPTKSSFAALVAGNLTSSSATTSSVSGASASKVGANSSSGLGSDAGTEAHEEREEEEALVFPTLNPIATPTANGFGALGSSRPTPARRAPTPRRPGTPSRSSSTSTPPPSSSTSSLNATSTHGIHSNNLNNSTMSGSSSNSNMPALSTQTQLASLRGALEAARLREEKNKAETEKYIKELDMLRWENANWRRGENEVCLPILTFCGNFFSSLCRTVIACSPSIHSRRIYNI
ncbi:hypothetical protein CPC08DRAFT_162378 [Agrocybe pediades]|nr:hypothetical protein CPC08DRAFT_162378 [Agrocybe pediades]